MLSYFQHLCFFSINYLFSSFIVFSICHSFCNMLHSIHSQLSRQPLFFYNEFQRVRGCRRCLVWACPLATFAAFGAASQHCKNVRLAPSSFLQGSVAHACGHARHFYQLRWKPNTFASQQAAPQTHNFDIVLLMTTFDFNFDDYDY